MVNKYFKLKSNEIKNDVKPEISSIQFLLNYSKSIEVKKGSKNLIFLIQN